MILQPAILALLISTLLTCLMVCYAGWYGVRILRSWDIRSGSELQLSLERRTYLISTIVSYALAFQLVSLFLFIYTADHLHGLFVGAMCAAGTLNVNGYGYPLLVLKIVNFLAAGVWLIVNHADTRGYDYPLIKIKYAILLVIAPLVILELCLQFGYFTGLHADVITSCCGSLFSLDRPGMAGDLAGLPGRSMAIVFYVCMAATFITGFFFLGTKKGAALLSLLSTATFGIAIAALISFFCLYFYELPTHHCPFCILQKEYGYIGYVLYLALLGGGLAGMGTGVLSFLQHRGSMIQVIPPLQRRLVLVMLIFYLAFLVAVSWRVLFTSFRLGS
jgi:hypothetical protein